MINAFYPLMLLFSGAFLSYAMGRAEHVYKRKYLAAATALSFFSVALILQILLASQVWGTGAASFFIGDTLLRMDALAVFIALIALILGSIITRCCS
jgi:hypothetical protein